MPLKHRLYSLIFSIHHKSGAAKAFHVFMGLLIVGNALAVFLETVTSIYVVYEKQFLAFEMFSVAIFSVEYLLRLWVSDLKPFYQRPIVGRIRYALTPMALIDLVSVLPSLLLMTSIDLRILRIMRLIRLLKLTRYSRAMHLITEAVKSKKDELTFSGLVMLTLLIVSAVLMYYAEHNAQPQNFSSIPTALWWAVVTLTTVGYGDIYPITLIGKVIASIVSALGIGLFALPGGLIAAALIEQARKPEEIKTCCPHCGGKL